MDEITQQQAREQYLKLPQPIRDVLSDDETVKKIEGIAQNNGLTKVEGGMLSQVTSMLMMGFIQPNQYVTEIEKNISVTREVAAHIAQEINRDIFNPIKDALKDVHATGKSAQATSAILERPLGTAAIIPPPMILPNLSVLPAHANDPIPVVAVPPKIVAPAVQVMPAPLSKPLPSFSIAQALGNIPSTGSSQSTSAQSEMPKAHVGTIAAASQNKEQSGNILEDKLGGTYRMKTETSSSVGVPSLQLSPTQIIPPPPQATTKAPDVQEKSALAKALDPYREAPL